MCGGLDPTAHDCKTPLNMGSLCGTWYIEAIAICPASRIVLGHVALPSVVYSWVTHQPSINSRPTQRETESLLTNIHDVILGHEARYLRSSSAHMVLERPSQSSRRSNRHPHRSSQDPSRNVWSRLLLGEDQHGQQRTS